MQKIFILLVTFLYLPTNYSYTNNDAKSVIPIKGSAAPALSENQKLYAEMQLESIVNYDAFEHAIAGYHQLEVKNKSIITLIDFTKPSTEERFYVLDMDQKKILYATHVSHGKNSGGNYATSFSNENGSLQSSLGFFETENTYHGKHGYSLILNGLEKGINDRAKERAIVIHSAAYANPAVIPSSGRLGRSFGCPALPQSISESVINVIKNGTLLFIYANKDYYLAQSVLF